MNIDYTKLEKKNDATEYLGIKYINQYQENPEILINEGFLAIDNELNKINKALNGNLIKDGRFDVAISVRSDGYIIHDWGTSKVHVDYSNEEKAYLINIKNNNAFNKNGMFFISAENNEKNRLICNDFIITNGSVQISLFAINLKSHDIEKTKTNFSFIYLI